MAYWIWVKKKDTYMNLSFNQFKKSKGIVIEIMKVAIPSTAEQLIISRTLTMAINAMLVIVSTTTAVAVYTASMRIVSMANDSINGNCYCTFNSG